jgi:hypothetical protein
MPIYSGAFNLGPLTRAAFFFFAILEILDLDEKTPLAQLGKRKRGPVEAGQGSPASEPTELSTQEIRVASPGHFGAASPTILSHDSELETETSAIHHEPGFRPSRAGDCGDD